MLGAKSVTALLALVSIALSTSPGLIIETVQSIPDDECVKAKAGDRVSVHYRGSFENGDVFDSSFERGDPIVFQLGVGQVIRGWDEGIEGMCVGEKRKLTIPSDLAYGDRGIGPIPGKATLYFDTELVDVAPSNIRDEL